MTSREAGEHFNHESAAARCRECGGTGNHFFADHEPVYEPSAAPVYRWHTQTLRGGGDVPPEERGDCVRACITSILGLPLDAIKNVHGENWWDRLRVQVNLHGYDLAITDTRWEPPMEAYWIATVPSLNLGPEPDGSAAEHCVVARGYTLIHDPSLGERYDDAKWVEAWDADKITAGWVLVPLDPAEVRRAA